MKKTFLFYDLETSGLSKPFDQIQQFAGKRLDESFNEIESSFLEARIAPDVIPSPYAVVTHQINMDEDAGKMSEFQATQLIHDMINTPNTISIGYNTLGFDDEFLRFAFYRNLLTPYTHQYANGCQRFDVFPLTIFYYLFENSVIKWPTINDKPTLKLEHLVTENDWFQGRAHYAMNDVDATIKLASHLKNANPEMWSYLEGYFDKSIDSDRIHALPMAFSDHLDFRYGLMIHSKFGAQNAYQAILLALGNHNHYKNQTVWLRLDKEDIEGFDFDDLSSRGHIIRKKYAEPGFMLPPTEHYTQHMSLDRMKTVSRNLEKIRKNFQSMEQVQRDAREYVYETVDQIDVDAGLYDLGFLTGDEQQFCHQFHLASANARSALLSTINNPNLKEQAKRIIWRESSSPVFNHEDSSIEKYIQAIMQGDHPTEIFDYRGERKRGVFEANSELATLRQNEHLSEEQEAVLKSYESWLTSKISRYID